MSCAPGKSSSRTLNQQAFDRSDAHVKRDCSESAQPARKNRKGQQALPLVGHAPHQPRDKTRVESCKPDPKVQKGIDLAEDSIALSV
jgi:hypothetical protein